MSRILLSSVLCPFAVLMIVVTGCGEKPAKTWYTISELEKEHELFEGYRVVKPPEFEGPYKLVRGVFATEYREANTYFHRSVDFDGKTWELRDDEGAGYGFRIISVENQKGERAPILLRTLEKERSYQEGGRRGLPKLGEDD